MDRERGIIIAIAIAGIVLLTFLYSHPGNDGGEGEARIIVSLHFGSEVLMERSVTPGYSVLDTLKMIANVSTAYGGGYVKAINGISENLDERVSWFYYVNGILSNVGASQYVVRAGDVIRWDYHRWGDFPYVSVELADFPEPLVHGFSGKRYGVVIAYEPGFRDEADLLRSKIPVDDVRVVPEDELEGEERVNVIYIGYSGALAEKLSALSEQVGMLYHVENGSVVDYNGTRFAGAFVEGFQSPFNPKGTWACENVFIWIGGSDPDSVKSAATELASGKKGFWLVVR